MPISFNIPLAGSLDGSHVHYINPAGEEETETGPVDPSIAGDCEGSPAAPIAKTGNLCVYAAEAEGVVIKNNSIFQPVAPYETLGAGTAGAIVAVTEGTGPIPNGWGAWAVTG